MQWKGYCNRQWPYGEHFSFLSQLCVQKQMSNSEVQCSQYLSLGSWSPLLLALTIISLRGRWGLPHFQTVRIAYYTFCFWRFVLNRWARLCSSSVRILWIDRWEVSHIEPGNIVLELMSKPWTGLRSSGLVNLWTNWGVISYIEHWGTSRSRWVNDKLRYLRSG